MQPLVIAIHVFVPVPDGLHIFPWNRIEEVFNAFQHAMVNITRISCAMAMYWHAAVAPCTVMSSGSTAFTSAQRLHTSESFGSNYQIE